MNEHTPQKKRRKIPFIPLVVSLLFLVSLAFIFFGQYNSSQSISPLIAGVTFRGEYKIGEEDWRPITAGEHISATDGDVTLKGFFQFNDPIDKTPIGHVEPGMEISLYLNHIGGSITVSSGKTMEFDTENKLFGEDACATMWVSCKIIDKNPVTIVLHNPHRFGNENAVDDFLSNMSLAPGYILEGILLKQGETERNIGLIIVLTSFIILGIAVFSTIIHIKFFKEMWLIGLMSFFAGCYFMFNAFGVSIWNDSYVENTRILGLSMMFYMLFTTALIASLLKGKRKKISFAAVYISGILILCLIVASCFDEIAFFDTWFYWAIAETLVVIILITCLIGSLKSSTSSQKLFFIIGIVTLASFPVDTLATHSGWWEGGLASQVVFLAVFMMMLVIVLRIIPANINSAIKARELEVEQQALKLELQESRISIMLSQMKPHFIFNTLNTIYHLCEINPDVARQTISSFSKYLRNNIENLELRELIYFEKELSFVKAYLDIEKVRFDDELEITFDIGESNFKLPVLTVQPIVENAVKHGTSKKVGVSKLSISTRATDTSYVIEIRDTGVGFNTENYTNDGQKHIGIANVRERLENMCGGSLHIESQIGIGTTATITIPKKEDFYEDFSSR